MVVSSRRALVAPLGHHQYFGSGSPIHIVQRPRWYRLFGLLGSALLLRRGRRCREELSFLAGPPVLVRVGLQVAPPPGPTSIPTSRVGGVRLEKDLVCSGAAAVRPRARSSAVYAIRPFERVSMQRPRGEG